MLFKGDLFTRCAHNDESDDAHLRHKGTFPTIMPTYRRFLQHWRNAHSKCTFCSTAWLAIPYLDQIIIAVESCPLFHSERDAFFAHVRERRALAKTSSSITGFSLCSRERIAVGLAAATAAAAATAGDRAVAHFGAVLHIALVAFATSF